MMSKCCNVLQSFSKWVLCIYTQVSLIPGILEHNINSSYIYEIKIMGRNILPLPLNKVLLCLTAQVSKKKTNSAIQVKENFGKAEKPKKTNNQSKNISWSLSFALSITPWCSSLECSWIRREKIFFFILL